MADLALEQLDIYYLHSVDEEALLEETLAEIDRLHRAGMFRRFGLSNFSAWQTSQIYYKCKELGYVLPSVYQGLYNPLSRSVESEVLPCCKMLGMAFVRPNPQRSLVLSYATLAPTSA
jgi:aflatoxin B1 aldehyde reductase